MPRERSEWIIEKTEAVASRGMVTADHPLAADAGVAMLRAGGNAVDAAVTAAFVIGVAEPFSNGVGGVAVAIIRTSDGRTAVIDGSSTAPLAAREDMFEAARGAREGMYGWPATVGNESNVGPRAVGVPGTVACLALALERYGTRSLADTLVPAIAAARDGVEVDPYTALTLASYADRLWKNEEATRIFYKEGRVPLRPALGVEPADRLVQPDLAATLERIAAGGIEAYYRGPIAGSIVDDVTRLGGILSREDFAAYRAREVAPLAASYRGHELFTVPEAAGGVTLVEGLNLLEGFPLAELEQSGTESLHLIAEAGRRAFVDRLTHLADPRFARVPFELLASKAYAADLRRTIDPRRATPAAVALTPEPAHTTHICAVDERRTMVSLTTTLGGGFGSGVVPRGTGIVLANVMTWFDPRPGYPNSVGPGKRILWAPAPTILLRGGAPFMAVGAPGGRKLISAVMQSVVNAVDYGDGPQAAVNRPRIHSEGRETLVDSRVREEVRAELAAMGHEIAVRGETLSSMWFGRPNAIVLERDGTLRGGVSRLKHSTAAGY